MRKQIICTLATLCVATLALAGEAVAPEPAEQVQALVERLQSGELEEVFRNFFDGSLVAAQKPTELRAMDAQTKSAIEFYSRPTAHEIVSNKRISDSLIRIKWITKHKDDAPLFWNGLFYKRNDKWEPLTVVFFDDPNKAGID